MSYLQLQTKANREQMRAVMFSPEKYGQPETHGCLTIQKYEANGAFLVLIFKGTAAKPMGHFRFNSEEKRQKYIDQKIADWKDIDSRKCQWRAERKLVGSDIHVGDVLYHSWGYDQTNIDFYRVVRESASRLWIVEIGSKGVEGTMYSHGMAQMVVADPDNTGDEVVMVSRGKYNKWDGRALYESWYA